MERGNRDSLPQRGRIFRGLALFTASGLLSACVPSEAAPESTPVRWEVTIPEVPYTPPAEIGIETTTTTIAPITECTYDGKPLLDGDHSVDLINIKTPEIDGAYGLQDLIDAEHPHYIPSQFAETYAEGLQILTGDEVGIPIVVDHSLDLGQWPADGETETATTLDLGDGESYTERDAYQTRIAIALETLVEQVSRYPREFYQSLGIEQIRLADMHDYYMAHFDPWNHEIEYDFDLNFTYGEAMFNMLAHELAHAYHYTYCGGADWNDPEFSSFNSIAYQGYAPDTTNSQGTGDIETTVPDTFFSYGPEREFVEPYGLSSPQEDFATIVEWTLTKRGIIQPEDADYNSPLYHKQQLVVDRLESLMPGARSYIETQTIMLRLRMENEIYTLSERPLLEISFDSLYDLINQTTKVPLVVDGLLANSFSLLSKPYPSIMSLPTLSTGYLDSGVADTDRYISISSSRDEDDKTHLYRDLIFDDYDKDLTFFIPESALIDGMPTEGMFDFVSNVLEAEGRLVQDGAVDFESIQQSPELRDYLLNEQLVPVTVRILSSVAE